MATFDRKLIRTLSMLGQRGTCGYMLTELAPQYENFLCMTADLCTTSGLDRFASSYPDRMLNIGIAEQNMVGVAAGLAMDGYQVFASTFATFASMRAVEQLRTMLAYMNLNVKLIGMASGFSMGFFGNTHYSMEDLAITRAIPNLKVLAPADALETAKMMELLVQEESPCYIRLTGAGNMPMVYREDYDLTLGKAVTLREGNEVCIIATGSMVYQACQAADALEKSGIRCRVLNMHTIKPLDTEAVQEAQDCRLIVTCEEHSVLGGMGGAVAEYLAEHGAKVPLMRIGIEDFYPKAGEYNFLLEQCGLTSAKIQERILYKISQL
ncbi:transketolase family protein [Candidatus Avoscillospira sp. LCP25S3_F1]|uniref:transketolase family protein n=1 Tax=Candidatus Avoscillospira sp. LCP25S3_F1 TaxID=3438825 RepID=UPI003F910E4F